MNNDERQQWVENDEGLYNWWKRSRLSMREFLRTHREQIDDVIRNVTGGTRQAHYLEYEDEAPSPAESCSLCGGGLYPLGTLGRLQHLRCRNCGAEFSRQATPRANPPQRRVAPSFLRAPADLEHPPWEKSFESLQRRRSVQCPQCDRPLEDCVCVSDLPQPKRYPAFVKTARDRALWDRAVERARQKYGEPIRYAYATYLFKKMGGGRWGDGR